MRRWEIDLQQRYEQDRRQLLDYREIDVEFRQLMMEVTILDEPVEPDPVIDIVLDSGIHDGKNVWGDQNENPDPEDLGPGLGELEECSTEDGREEAAVTDDYDIYESLYDEIADYKSQMRISPNKKKKKKK